MFMPLYLTSRVSLLYRFPCRPHRVHICPAKVHFYFYNPIAPAVFAAAASYIKGKTAGEYPLALASWVDAKSSRMSLKTPVYVAGFERGVLPMGDWSMSIILSRYSVPLISLYAPGLTLAWFSSEARARYSIIFTRDDFPLPDTPVTQLKASRGNLTSRFLRLFSEAPRISRNLPFPVLRVLGTGINCFPLRYWPVMDSSQSRISLGVPAKTIFPPWTPAPGPTSTI